MEPKGRRKRSADQLQGLALQDQAVRSVAARPSVTAPSEDIDEPGLYKIVVRYEDHSVRGYVRERELGSIEELLRNEPKSPLDTLEIRQSGTHAFAAVSTEDAKAVFFVKTFEGDLRHRALHFHEHAPIVPGLWVRVTFHDGEVIEGIITNSRDYVLDHGFFMKPTDPNGNNRLIYVLKNRLEDFNVLGMRNTPKS